MDPSTSLHRNPSFGYWDSWQQFPASSQSSGHHRASHQKAYNPRRPHWTRWLTSYVTSRPRQMLFALLYLGVFGTQVLTMRWVGMTGVRWIQSMVDLWPAQGGWATRGCYSVSTLVLILMVVGVVLMGVLMAVCQLLYILELMLFNPDAGRGEKREKKGRIYIHPLCLVNISGTARPS